MSLLKRATAALLTAIMLFQGIPVFGEETETDEKLLTVSKISAGDERMSSEYWENYKIDTDTEKDVYIESYSNNGGQYYKSALVNAFDGNWSTHWETGKSDIINYVDVTFNKTARIDRIIYATRQDGSKGKGYPSILTIYSYDSESEQWEKVAQGSSIATGSYVIITLPEAVDFEKLRFEFTEAYNKMASASEFVFLRSDDTVINGNVKISGNVIKGGTIRAEAELTTGDENALKYQWQYSDDGIEFVDIENANDVEYTINEYRKYFRVVVGDKSGKYFGTIKSSTADYARAYITGSPQVGSTVSTSIEVSGVDYTYIWQVSESADGTFTDIEGAGQSSYKLTENELNKYVRVQYTFKNGEIINSEPVLIEAANTYPEYTEDYIDLSDLPSSALIESSVGYGTLQYDQNLAGGKISLLVDGVKKYFTKGLCANANAKLVYDVSFFVQKYQYEKLTAYVGLDSSKGSNGNGVIFNIYTSKDNSTWTSAAATGVLKGDTNCEYIEINLKNANYVKFEIGANGSNAYDHAVIAGGKLSKASYDPQYKDYDFIKKVSEYDRELKSYETGSNYEELLNNTDYRKILYQRTFVNNADYELLQAIAHTDEKSKNALEWFMNDFEALDYYVNGGPISSSGTYARSVQTIIDLYNEYSEDMDNSLYKRIFIALSLVNAVKLTSWTDGTEVMDPVKRYASYKKLYDKGYLINRVFENLNVTEMKWVVGSRICDEEIEWLNYFLRSDYYKDVHAGEDVINERTIVNPYAYITYNLNRNLANEEYYKEENREKWQSKYHLVNTEAADDDDDFDINVKYLQGHKRNWMAFAEGEICGGISETGANIATVFGIPSMYIGQPGHAAYLRYRYDDSDNGNYKDAIYEIWNNVSGWTKSTNGRSIYNGWGNESWNSSYPGSYVIMSQTALNDYDNYIKAEDCAKMAAIDISDTQRGEALCEIGLNYQNINIDVWKKLVEVYVQAGKSESEFLALAERAADYMTYYPLPMRDVVENLICPNISSSAVSADASNYINTALLKASKATKDNIMQPDACKTMANYILGNEDYELASFSFNGDNANKIVLNDSFKDNNNEVLYSIDGGTNWLNAGMVNEFKLTDDEISKITPENDILVKLQGSSSHFTIDITKGTAPTGLYINDNENRVIGAKSTMEWSEDNVNWNKFDDVRFTGERTIYVRNGANGTILPSDSLEYRFTEDTSTKERSYITNDRISVKAYSSYQGSTVPQNTIDGNINTIWHTNYSAGAGTDTERYIEYEFTKPVYLTAVDYTPRQSGSNGRFTSCEVYVSDDGSEWRLAGSGSGWANNALKKSVELDEPVYTKYVKVVGKTTMGGYGSAAMVEFYESLDYNLNDINGDGKIDSADGALIMKYVTGINVGDFDEKSADVNNDGNVDILDVIAYLNNLTD